MAVTGVLLSHDPTVTRASGIVERLSTVAQRRVDLGDQPFGSISARDCST